MIHSISIIICCYNSRSKIEKTLVNISKLDIPAMVQCEIIVVDNNCTDDTVEIVKKVWNALESPFSLSIIVEKVPGLNTARVTGAKNSKGNLILFCDDDNWLCSEYIKNALKHFSNDPMIGIVGGVGEPVSDVAFPKWFFEVKGFGYAVGNEGRTNGFVDSVYGAGMVLRRDSFLKISSSAFILTDRRGNSLASGGDTEICRRFLSANFKIVLDESMTFKHFINKERLSWKYYLSLRRSFGEANAKLFIYMNGDIKEKRKAFLTFLRYSFRNIHFLIFPFFNKSKFCAQFFQDWQYRLTLLKY